MSNAVSKAVKVVAAVLLLNISVFSSSAFAWSIDGQTRFELEGLFGGWLRPESGEGDNFRVNFNDIIFDGVLDQDAGSFAIEGEVTGAITNQTDSTVHDATMAFSVVYEGLDIGVDSVTGTPLDAIGRSGSEAGLGTGTFEVTSTLVDFQVAGASKSARITENSSQRAQDFYSELVGSGFFDIVLGNLAFFEDQDVFKTWIRSTEAPIINGERYNFYGDFHTVAGEVPEPATVVLLGLAFAGLAVRSRKAIA